MKNENSEYINNENLQYAVNSKSNQLETNKKIKLYEEVILYDTYNDYVTNIPNRLAFFKKLDEAIYFHQLNTEYKAAALLIDINDFKMINDAFSYEIGDKVLIRSTEKLKEITRKQDSIFRIGNDEFAVLLLNIKSKEKVNQKAEEILEKFNDFMNIDGLKIHITVDIGVALVSKNRCNANEIFKNAEIAMNMSKTQGRSKYNYYNELMKYKIARNMNIEGALIEAIEKNKFTLYYQPQIDINYNKVYGLEALIRCEYEKLSTISPSYFIYIAEENGMIDKIWRYALVEVCREILSLKREGFCNIVISINASAIQFEEKEFAVFYERTLDNMNVEGKNICIEITERMLLNPSVTVINNFANIRKKGTQIFIDDFGTKYSALNYLKDLPIDGIKIDKTFIKNIPSNSKSLILLKNIIRLAKEMMFKIIVEGVEETEQLNYLEKIGCDIIQGFIFSKPIASDKIIETINRYNK